MGDHLPGSCHFFFISPCFYVFKSPKKKVENHHGSGNGKYGVDQFGSSLSQGCNVPKAEYIANGNGSQNGTPPLPGVNISPAYLAIRKDVKVTSRPIKAHLILFLALARFSFSPPAKI